jgi:hypothetical protein
MNLYSFRDAFSPIAGFECTKGQRFGFRIKSLNLGSVEYAEDFEQRNPPVDLQLPPRAR